MGRESIALLLCVMFLFCLPPLSLAKAQLKFGSDVRLRYEFQGGFNQKFYGEDPKMGKEHDGFLLGRFRFGLDLWPSRVLHLKLWIQDAEAWDMALPDKAFYNSKLNNYHNPNKDRWELSDSYIELSHPWGLPIKLKAGRQRIFYGDKRVFGPGAWGNSGRWVWDAIKLSYVIKGAFLDAYYGRTMIHQPNQFSLNHRHFYESFGFYGHVALGFLFIEPFFMSKRDDHDRYRDEKGRIGDLDTYYAGARVYIEDMKGFTFDVTYARQFGDWGNDNIRAYGYHVLAGYKFSNLAWCPVLSMEYSYASGDSDPHDGDHETFDGAFGARDKMYGRMNLFYWRNLRDTQVNLELFPKKWLYIKAEYHWFDLADAKDAWYLNPITYRDPTGHSGKHIGREFDIVARLRPPKTGEVQLGYGHFWPSGFCRNFASEKEANWFFFQWRMKRSWKVL